MEVLGWILSGAQTLLDWLNANSDGVGILATVISLLAAASSSISARRSAKAASSSALQTLSRELAVAAKEVTVQVAELETLELSLTQAYVSLAVFTGNTGSSRLEAFTRRASERVAEAKAKATTANEIISAPHKLKTRTSEDLDELKLQIEMINVELGSVQKIMREEFQQVNDQVKMYQQKQVSISPR
jgi:cellobiose-specific phosphotransferase system component IIA